jgi:hypothetical protein
MEEFLKAFWPDFASTVLGLVLGLPFALWTDRRIKAHAQKAERFAEREVLNRALDAIVEALNWNCGECEKLKDLLASGNVPIETPLDSSTWDAVKATVTERLQSPHLQRRIAFHFSQIESLARLFAIYVDSCAGVSAMVRAADGKQLLKVACEAHLPAMLENLEKEAAALIQEIRQHKQGM